MIVYILIISFIISILALNTSVKQFTERLSLFFPEKYAKNHNFFLFTVCLTYILPKLLICFYALITNHTKFIIPFIIGSEVTLILLILGSIALNFGINNFKLNLSQNSYNIFIFVSFLLVLFTQRGRLEIYQSFIILLILLIFFLGKYLTIFNKITEIREEIIIKKQNVINVIISFILMNIFSYFTIDLYYKSLMGLQISSEFLIVTLISIITSVPIFKIYYDTIIEKDSEIINKTFPIIFLSHIVILCSLGLFKPILSNVFFIYPFGIMFLLLISIIFYSFRFINKLSKFNGFIYLIIYVIFFFLSFFNANGY